MWPIPSWLLGRKSFDPPPSTHSLFYSHTFILTPFFLHTFALSQSHTFTLSLIHLKCVIPLSFQFFTLSLCQTLLHTYTLSHFESFTLSLFSSSHFHSFTLLYIQTFTLSHCKLGTNVDHFVTSSLPKLHIVESTRIEPFSPRIM